MMINYYLFSPLHFLMEQKDKRKVYQDIGTDGNLPLFHHPFWLNTVAGPENWNVALSYNDDGQVQGLWPYAHFRLRGLIPANGMPLLTPYLGPWLFYPESFKTPAAKYAFEEKVLTELAVQLPATPFTHVKCHPRLRNWLPLHRLGFRQTTRYTYRIAASTEWESAFSSSLRSDIRRARRKYALRNMDDPELFYQINRLSFHQQKRKIPYTLDFFSRLDQALKHRNQRQITAAYDDQNNIVAALYTVWDDHTVYYLASGIDREQRPSGAMSLLLSEAIETAMQQGKTFDFEGSMIPGIEKFFRSFGGELTPYHFLTRTPNRYVEALSVLLFGR